MKALLVLLLCAAAAIAQVAPKRVLDSQLVRECRGTHCVEILYQWVEWPDHMDRIYLERAGVTIGGWHRGARHYRRYDAANGRWSEPEDCAPIPVPEQPPMLVGGTGPMGPMGPIGPITVDEPPRAVLVTDDEGVENFGIAPQAITGKPRCTINGREVSQEQQFEALTAGRDLVDDSQRWHLTIVGSLADRRAITEDLDNASALSEWKGKLHVQALAPTHWAIEHRKLRPLGDGVTIFVRDPAGAELLRIEGYQGPEDLAGRLRKIKEPDAKPAPLDGLRDFSALTAWMKRNWLPLGMIVLVTIALARRREVSR